MDYETMAETMLDLFEGRTDAYGGDEGRACYAPVTSSLVVDHLTGVLPIGTYCCRHIVTDVDVYNEMSDDEQLLNMTVKWGCCDIDTGDWNEAYMLTKVLEGMGLKPWVERSRSKGWHVWLFSDAWVPAFIMRRCLKVAYKAIELQAREANPKSERLRPNQLGNYVRMPYKGALVGGNVIAVERQTMMDWTSTSDGSTILMNDWLALSPLGLLTSDNRLIRRWASKWFEPPKANISTETITSQEVLLLSQRLSKPLHKLWENGPANGDTSQGLMALAYNTAKVGWSPTDVFAIVCAADMRWGKYHQRQDFEMYVTDIVERAFR